MAVMREGATTEKDLSSLMSMHVDDLDLTVRARNCLRLAGIVRVADLVRKTPAELQSIRSMGRKTVRDIERSLYAVGLRLGMLPLPSPGSVASPEAYASDDERGSVVVTVPDDIISMHVDWLRLTTRSSNGLHRAGIASVADLVRRSPAEIRAIQGMGVTSVRDIEDRLAPFGLRLAMNAEEVSVVLRGSSVDAQDCDAFLDVMKLLGRAGIAHAADVTRLTREEVLGLPGVSLESLQVLEDGLNRWGLRLRFTHRDADARTPEEPTNVPATPEPAPPVKSERAETALEELSRAVVDLLAGAKGASSRAFLAHHGLDGMAKRTLQEIGDAGDQYGFSRPVTRERVRQILKNTERRLRARSRHGQFVRWKSATDDALRDLPASVASFTSRFGHWPALVPERVFKELELCAGILRLDFPFDLQTLPELGSVVVRLDSGAERAFASHLRELAMDSYVDVADVTVRIGLEIESVTRIVEASSRLEFLDDARRYFWRRPILPPRNYAITGNAILTSLCKVFSVAAQVTSTDLALSLPRDRMLRKAGSMVEIPLPVVEGIAERSGLFHVRDGRIMRKGKAEWLTVGPRDAVLLGICAEHGRVIPSNVLYKALVRSGLAQENAAQVVVYSPFLVHTRSGVGPKEGIYKFVVDPGDVDFGALDAHFAREGEKGECREQPGAQGGSHGALEEGGTSELLLEIPVSSRTQLSGRFFASATLGLEGNWNVQDRNGVDLGLINVTGRTVTGLVAVVKALRLVKGDVMGIRFDRARGLATAERGR